jgi:hypothetical protein
MTDRDDIRDLCFTYTFHLDDGDFAAVGLLLENAILRPTMPGVEGVDIGGRDAVEAFYRKQVVTYKRGRPMTRHLITNQVIVFGDNGLTARSRSYFTVLQRPPGLPFQIVVGGQYRDEFEKVDGSWRFTLKNIQVDHLNDIENHFRIAPELAV